MILICDDDATVRSSLTLVLKRAGYEVALAATRQEVIEFVRDHSPELILMDMNYSHSTTGEEGLALLNQVKIFRPQVPVILITAWGSIELAVKGMRNGAFDFITKPWNNLALLNRIRTAIQLQEKSEEKAPHSPFSYSGKIIGRSPLLLQALQTVERIANTQAPVLITGESGTGKELIAEAIHEFSDRKKEAFIKVNLGGISQSLFESEMFGHKKGAFTDAHYDRTGRFEMADKGTIFLDEIGELDMVCQVKLLRVLQDQTFEILGDSRPRQIHTKVISATNRSLNDMVVDGTFREDLFYRINLITIRVPALRERCEDIPLLVNHFIQKQAVLTGKEDIKVDPDAWEYLQRLPYPGNIRELKNLVERTILVSGKQTLSQKDFQSQYVETSSHKEISLDKVQPLEQMEKSMILRAIRLYGNNHTKIALALGITRQTLYRRLEKYNIQIPQE